MWCIHIYHVAYGRVVINRLYTKEYAENKDHALRLVFRFMEENDIVHISNEPNVISAVCVHKKNVFHIVATNIDSI